MYFNEQTNYISHSFLEQNSIILHFQFCNCRNCNRNENHWERKMLGDANTIWKNTTIIIIWKRGDFVNAIQNRINMFAANIQCLWCVVPHAITLFRISCEMFARIKSNGLGSLNLLYSRIKLILLFTWTSSKLMSKREILFQIYTQ